MSEPSPQGLPPTKPRQGLAGYTIGSCIGVGQFGKVLRAVHTATATPVALKIISLLGRSRADLLALKAEIHCHVGLAHPNIVRCLDCFQSASSPATTAATAAGSDDGDVIVVMELCVAGDLLAALRREGRFEEDRVRRWGSGIAKGLRYLHCERGIVHRDLKLQNILIGADGEAKICDFGFSKLVESKELALTSVKGTPIYMAPEIIREQPYTRKVDLWALGVIMYELFTGSPPFYATSIFTLIDLILTSTMPAPPAASAGFTSLLQSLLEKDPAARIDWPELADAPFWVTSGDEHQQQEEEQDVDDET
ncbi:kinase-like domain-containing protein, partial [Zopfochytrium polystomum]